MKAIVCTKYGPPDVLQLKEVTKPTPKDKEVLMKVLAASANRGLAEGEEFLVMLDCFRYNSEKIRGYSHGNFRERNLQKV